MIIAFMVSSFKLGEDNFDSLTDASGIELNT